MLDSRRLQLDSLASVTTCVSGSLGRNIFVPPHHTWQNGFFREDECYRVSLTTHHLSRPTCMPARRVLITSHHAPETLRCAGCFSTASTSPQHSASLDKLHTLALTWWLSCICCICCDGVAAEVAVYPELCRVTAESTLSLCQVNRLQRQGTRVCSRWWQPWLAPSRHAPVRQILLQHFAVQGLSLTRKWILFTDTILPHMHVASRSPHLQPFTEHPKSGSDASNRCRSWPYSMRLASS